MSSYENMLTLDAEGPNQVPEDDGHHVVDGHGKGIGRGAYGCVGMRNDREKMQNGDADG
jgi:hypothetical protein